MQAGFLIISTDPTGEIHHASLMKRLAGGRHLDETRARKKHISYARYSHFLAEDSDPLGFWAAALLGQTELLLVFGVLLFQSLELKRNRQRTEGDTEYSIYTEGRLQQHFSLLLILILHSLRKCCCTSAPVGLQIFIWRGVLSLISAALVSEWVCRSLFTSIRVIITAAVSL